MAEVTPHRVATAATLSPQERAVIEPRESQLGFRLLLPEENATIRGRTSRDSCPLQGERVVCGRRFHQPARAG